MSDDWTHQLEGLQDQIAQLRERVDYAAAARRELVVPDCAEFILSDEYLKQEFLFPRQLTLMRMVFLELDNLTDYDHQVIDEWEAGFVPGHAQAGAPSWWEPAPDRDYTRGTPGDVRARMAEMRQQGRQWFREVNLVCGRRAGKGHLGALMCAKLLWSLLALRDPQAHFGIPKSKKIQIPVFAGNHEQARFNLFADIVNVIVAAPCFEPYMASLTMDRLTLATPADLSRPDRHYAGTIEIVAKESTMTAGRGAANIAQFYDEMAFIDRTTSKSSAEEIYSAATPAMDQFGPWAMLSEGSSPHHQTGEFFAIHARAREIDPVTGTAAYPEILTLQAASWDLYIDSATAEETRVCTAAEAARVPALRDHDGSPRCFPPPGEPKSAYDHQMRQLERQDPERFRVERLSQWATVDDAFLRPELVDRVFLPFRGTHLVARDVGKLSDQYVIVADPAASHDAFAWMVGHPEVTDDGHHHVVVDRIQRWLPADHGGDLPLDEILDQIAKDAQAFRAARVIVDQYGGDFVVQGLNQRLYGQARAGHSAVAKLPRTRDRNLQAANILREALQLGHVHCYLEPQLERELRFLRTTPGGVAAPTSGPVKSDDVAFCLMVLVEDLLGEAASAPVFEALGGSPLHAMPGHPPTPADQQVLDQLSAFGQPSRFAGGKPRDYPRRGFPPRR